MAGRDRCYKSRHILHALVADNKLAHDQCVALESKKNQLDIDIPSIEQQIVVLQKSLASYKVMYEQTAKDYERIIGRWDGNDRKIPGLCLRFVFYCIL